MMVRHPHPQPAGGVMYAQNIGGKSWETKQTSFPWLLSAAPPVQMVLGRKRLAEDHVRF